MNEINRIFNVNSRYIKCRLDKASFNFTSLDREFGAKQLLALISFVNGIHKKYPKVNIPIYLNFKEIEILDKLSYILLECICYSLIKDYHHAVSISWKPIDNIHTQGVFSSPLALLNTENAKRSQKFIEKFGFEIYKYHFRKVVAEGEADTNYLGNLQQQISSFLSTFYIEEDYIDDIVEMIGEIVGNAIEHAHSQCLLDIDVTTDHTKSIESVLQEGSYYGVNIVILNFSEVLFGDRIKERIKKDELQNNERYMQLSKAYSFHKEQFSDRYRFEDFCNIASMQHKISGDKSKGNAGGKGLTTLIRSLQEKSDKNSCYMLSGKRIVFFQKDVLQYDDDRWLGFNEECNFFSDVPHEKVINECIVEFPGTAYNLNFILKREERLDERY